MVNKYTIVKRLCKNAWESNAIGSANILEKAIEVMDNGGSLNDFITDKKDYYSKHGDFEVLGALKDIENIISEVIPAINKILDEIEEYGDKINEYNFEHEEKLKKQREEFIEFKERIVQCTDRNEIYSLIEELRDEDSELYSILKSIFI